MSTPRRARERGFTLLELLVAIGIAAVVLGGLASAVQSQSRSAIFALGSADMSQDVRSAIGLFKRDVRMAGYNLGAVPPAFLAPIVVNANGTGEFYHITLRGNYQNVSSTGSAARKCVTRSHTFVESGRVPVSRLERVGEQTACCT